MRELFLVTINTLEQNVIYYGDFCIHGGYPTYQ